LSLSPRLLFSVGRRGTGATLIGARVTSIFGF
jgi:hypothetical protein